MRHLLAFAIGFLLFASPAVAQTAADRGVALVIGNGKYRHQKELANPVNDARGVAASLKRLGFDVIDGFDLTLADMQAKLVEFADRLDKGAPSGVLYYAGHGVQVKGQNYLIPVDADIARAAEVDFKLLPLANVRKLMEASKAQARILILDACRNNPFPDRAVRAGLPVGGGLATERKAVGTYIAFATAPEAVAEDGQGTNNSPFTTSLLRHIETSGRSIGDMMTHVRRDVLDATQHRQTPWDENGLAELFYFAPGQQVDPTTPSLDAGRLQLRKHNLANAKWHFEALAAQGNVEAMRELYLMAESARDNGEALGWLAKAADAGDRSARVTYAWLAGHRDLLGDLPKEWEEKLTKSEGKRRAAALYREGEADMALLLQSIADEEANSLPALPGGQQRPWRPVAELQQEIDRDNANAVTLAAYKRLEPLPDVSEAKPAHKVEVGAALRLFERGARRGSPLAIERLVGDESLTKLMKRFALTSAIPPAETTTLLVKAATAAGERAAWGTNLEEAHASARAAPYRDGELAMAAVERLLKETGPNRDLTLALRLAEDAVAMREVIHKNARRGSIGELSKARRLKATVLFELKRAPEAIAALGDIDNAEDLAPIMTLAATVGWPPALVTTVLDGFNKACGADISFGNAAAEMSDCEKIVHAALKAQQAVLYAPANKSTRTWLQTNDSDTVEKGRAHFQLAMLGQADAALLRADESVQTHLTMAARLGATDAVAALTARNWPVPDMLANMRFNVVSLQQSGEWRPHRILDRGVASACRSETTTAILTRAVPRRANEKPVLRVDVDLAARGVGRVVIDTGAEATIDPTSLRVFVGRDEHIGPFVLNGAAITLPGDQALFITKLANSAMLRLEYRAIHRNNMPLIAIDVFTLEGFTSAYRTLLGECPSMTSAFAQVAAAQVAAKAAADAAGKAAPPVAVTSLPPPPAAPPVPKAPTTAPPAAGKSPAPTKAAVPTPVIAGVPPAAGNFARQVGRYFKGHGVKRDATSYEQCAAACAATPTCRALEFQHANATCQLYDRVEPSFEARGTDIAIRQ